MSTTVNIPGTTTMIDDDRERDEFYQDIGAVCRSYHETKAHTPLTIGVRLVIAGLELLVDLGMDRGVILGIVSNYFAAHDRQYEVPKVKA